MDQYAERVVRGVVSIASDSERVTDADEEVFILYSDLQAGPTPDVDGFRGLGHVDSRQDTMTITFELKAPNSSTSETLRSQRTRKTKKVIKLADKTVQIEIAQDKTALRSRKGDTGSVVWKASIDFAQLILQQLYAQATLSLFDTSTLKTAHVVELGAGTGLLAVAFAPYVGHYTVTDIEALQPLLRKNIAANFTGWPDCMSTLGSNVSVKELDWVILNNTSRSQRGRLVDIEPADLVLVVDCIYHPSLLPSLVETIDHLTISGRTAVLVIVELRAEDVIREFLALWLSRPGWEIWRVLGSLLERPYAMWLGWRTSDAGELVL